MDLFEIVSSFIPDEQKADIKAKIDGELRPLQGAMTNSKTLKKYGVNLYLKKICEKRLVTHLFQKRTS